MDTKDSEPMAITWIESLNRHHVPYEYYMELYYRSIDLRIRRFDQGLNADDFSVDMMLACWNGRHGLREELQRADVESGRVLPSAAQSQCQRCHGLDAGMEDIYDDNGRRLGSRKGCDHRPIVEGEGIWVYLQQCEQAAGPRAV